MLLWVEKIGQNTQYVAKQIAAAAGLKARLVSYAGLKDRHAVTRQWFCLPVPIKQELAWQVTYCNAGNPGFGVNAILLQPGTPDEKCFFSNTNGCNLDPIPSLKASGFSVKRVCGGGGCEWL